MPLPTTPSGLQAIAALGADHRLLQRLVEGRAARPRPPSGSSTARRARKRRDAGVRWAQLHLRALGHGLPAAVRRDLAIAGQAALQGHIAGVARRRAVQPRLQAALGQRLGQVRAGVVGRRTNLPAARGTCRGPSARCARRGHSADQGRGQRGLLVRRQGTAVGDAIGGIGLGLQAVQVGARASPSSATCAWAGAQGAGSRRAAGPAAGAVGLDTGGARQDRRLGRRRLRLRQVTQRPADAKAAKARQRPTRPPRKPSPPMSLPGPSLWLRRLSTRPAGTWMNAYLGLPDPVCRWGHMP